MINLKKILAYIVIFILLFQESIQRMVSLSIIDCFDELFIVFLSLAALARFFQRKSLKMTNIILLFLMLMFLIFGSLSLVLNSSVIISRYIESSFLAIKCFLLIIDVSILGFNDDDKKMFLETMNNIGVLCVIIGIFNFIFPSLYSKIFPFAIVTRRFGFVSVTSLFYHTGRFGWFMLFLSLMNYTLYKKDINPKSKKFFIMFGLCSMLSFRTKVISSIIIILIINTVITKKIEMKKIITSLIAVFIVFILFKDVIINTYDLYFNDSTDSVSARQSLLDNSYEIMKDYFPLGVGFGKYGSWYARIYYSEYYYKYHMTNVYGLSPSGAYFATDTFWSAIFGESGVLGSICYISFIIYMFRLLKKNITLEKSIKAATISFSLFVLIQSIIESFGEPSFNSPPQNIFLALVVGAGLYECINKNEVVS